jgi:hypothetical protein
VPGPLPWATVSKLNPALTGYEWTFGRRGTSAIAVHPEGGVVVVGSAAGASFPTYNQTASYQPSCVECDYAIVVARVGDAPQPNPQYEQDDPAVTYEGPWTMVPDPQASGGTLAESNARGARVTITFTGTGIQIFGRRGPTGGRLTAEDWFRNSLPPTASFYSDPVQPRALMLSITGLANGAHVLVLTNTTPATQAGTDVWFDGFTVLTTGPVPTATPASRATWAPTVTPRPWPSPSPTASPTATATAPPTPARFEQTAASYQGLWFTNNASVHSGGSAAGSMDAGDRATFTFNGTGVTWIGYADEWSGIARVFVDGSLQATVDTYASPHRARTTLFTASGLAPGHHTLVVEVTGARGPHSGGAWIWIDAFDVVSDAATPTPTPTTPGATPTAAPTRVEQPSAFTQGLWFENTASVHSGGSAIGSVDVGSRATLTFTGTGVTWIGYSDEWSGLAKVYVDGTLQATVDTYSSPFTPRRTLFTATGLTSGLHRLVIEVTGQRGPGSANAWIWIDAFDIQP